MRRPRLSMLHVVALMHEINSLQGVQVTRVDNDIPTSRHTPKCIVCGKIRYHNNSFCSAECCKQYKAQNKLTK